MSDFLREYFRTHDGQGSPLLVLRDHVRDHRPPEGETVKRLAAELKLPHAAVRAAASYYSDLHAQRHALHVCQGTSCMLNGAAELQATLETRNRCNTVYCLGYCDRSPAVLRPDDAVIVGADTVDDVLTAQGADGSPSIRSSLDQPIVTQRIGRGDFSALAAAEHAGVYATVPGIVEMDGPELLDMIERSGIRGRGGAGFPTGPKWRICAETPADRRYVIANGDEGDPGSYIDRVLMEQDPHALLEGMMICARAVGADRGVVFVRSEYPRAIERISEAVSQATAAGRLGDRILGSAFSFHVSVMPGMGSYVCGEETALLNAIEGFRGEVRVRPPYPAESGLYGRPTVVNNVETLVQVPWIVQHGVEAYRARGTATCAGTKAMCLNRGFANPGIVEVEFGTSLRQVIEDHAGGGRDGKPLAAVILGGVMGSILLPNEWEIPVCYTTMNERGVALGHGGLVAVPEDADFQKLLVHWLTFMQHESCGKCVPCRVGSQLALEQAQRGAVAQRDTVRQLLHVMEKASLCAFGQQMPLPIGTLLKRFGDRISDGGPLP